jgi:hypothetical protein
LDYRRGVSSLVFGGEKEKGGYIRRLPKLRQQVESEEISAFRGNYKSGNVEAIIYEKENNYYIDNCFCINSGGSFCPRMGYLQGRGNDIVRCDYV